MLGKESGDRVSVANEGDGAAGVGVVFLFGIDAEIRVKGGGHIVWADALVGRFASGIVAFADNLAAAYATASHEHEHAAGIVVAASFGGAGVDFRGTAEFASDEDRGFVQQTAFGESVKKRGEADVELRQKIFTESCEIVLVRVPAPDGECHETDPGLDEANGEQATHTERLIAKGGGEGGGFLVDVEGGAGFFAGDDGMGLLAELIEAFDKLVVGVVVGEGCVERLQ